MLIFSLSFASASWGDNSWVKRQEINITNVGSTDLTNFPAYINVTYNSNMRTDYADLRFMNGSCSEGQSVKLAYEIENYTKTKADIWVRIPNLKIGTTSICMYYNNSGASNGENVTGVWDNYSMVYHFNEPSGTTGTDSVLDSTGNTNGTPSSGISFGDTGKIGTTADFSSGTGISLGTVGSSVLTAETTVSFWINTNNYASPSRQNPFDQAYGGWGTMTLETNTAIDWYFGNNGGNGASYIGANSGAVAANGQWVFITGVRNPNGHTYKWYKNGVYLKGSTYSSTYPVIKDRTFTIGDGYVHPLNGRLDEFRISKVARSADWIKQSYQLVANQESYVDFGTEEDADVTPPQITLNSPIDAFNTSSQNMIFNFTGVEDYPGAINCSLYIDDIYQMKNATTLNNTLTNLNASGISGGLNSWYVSCMDKTGNVNNSATRNFYIDIYGPTITNISYTPSDQNTLDPGTIVNFSATLKDDRVNVSKVILQYYNGTAWKNATMGSPNDDGNYNASITTSSGNASYTFNIWANDSFGNSNVSSNHSFESLWDCSWDILPSSLVEVMGFYENKWIGNVTILNNGDPEYYKDNCSITFATSFEGFSSDYWSSPIWVSNNRGIQMPSSVVVGASSNSTFGINASFPSTSSPFTETPRIIITANINDSVNNYSSKTVESTIIVSPPNPLLYQKVISKPLTVFLTPVDFSINASVRNLGGDSTVNNTAYNVTFNWTLPHSLSSRIGSGEKSLFYVNLSNNSMQFNYLNFSLNPSNLRSMDKGVLNITLYSLGYKNDSGNFTLITNSGNRTILNNTISIQFLCYDVSDGICVSSCGVGADPDCKPVVESPKINSGGSGGGVGTISPLYEESNEHFELLRGNVQKFMFPIRNKLDVVKKDIHIEVGGINSKYIKIYPSIIPLLEPHSYQNITVIITAPAYFNSGSYNLIFKLKGEVVSNNTVSFVETKNVKLFIIEVPREDTEKMINKADSIIKKMNSSGLFLGDVSPYWKKIMKDYNETNFLGVKNNYNNIKKIYDAATESNKIINELKNDIKNANRNGVQTIETQKVLYVAQAIFDRGDYVLALNKLQSAKLMFALETKGESNILYTIKNNPYQSLFSFFGLLIFSFGSSLAVKSKLYKRKLKLLKKEEELLLELMKVVQRDCFEKDKMSMEEYREAMGQYEKKLSETVEEKIVTEAKLANIYKIKGKKRAFEEEKKRLTQMIMDVQDKYLNKSQIEARVYDNTIKSYTTKLADISGKLAVIESEEALRGNGFFGRLFSGINRKSLKLKVDKSKNG